MNKSKRWFSGKLKKKEKVNLEKEAPKDHRFGGDFKIIRK